MVLIAMVLPILVTIGFSMADFGAGKPYQILIAAWTAAGMAAFIWLNRVPPVTALIAPLALAAGMALGFDMTLLRHAPRVTDAVINPVEHMMVFSSAARAEGLGPSLLAIMGEFFSGKSLFANHRLTLFPVSTYGPDLSF